MLNNMKDITMIPVGQVKQMEQQFGLLEEHVVQELIRRRWHICCAESCTGGLLSATLVNVSGASDILNESYVTYSNEAKHRILGVSEEILATLGAVSKETAAWMAEGAAKVSGAEVGIGVTGIAGPTGGTKEKPVGLVYIGLFVKNQVYVSKCHFEGNRLTVRQSTVKEALALLLHLLTEIQDVAVPSGSHMIRYSVITEKNPREIVLLRGRGCAWRKCRFCDYHLDYSTDEAENYQLNASVLSRVSGVYGMLEVINSGSFVDLDEATMNRIEELCREKSIRELHFECHYMHKDCIAQLKQRFARIGVTVKMKLGVETFDRTLREEVLKKGIDETAPEVICEHFDEICLLVGITGQTKESIITDIENGLRYVERVCINVFENNTTSISADESVISVFLKEVVPLYEQNPRVDILIHNTDYGVGGQV